jgi:hypothetical protein
MVARGVMSQKSAHEAGRRRVGEEQCLLVGKALGNGEAVGGTEGDADVLGVGVLIATERVGVSAHGIAKRTSHHFP